jgi:hypothetical protein
MYEYIAFFTFFLLSFVFLWVVPLVPPLRRAAMVYFEPDRYSDSAVYDLLKAIDGQFEWDALIPATILYLLISICVFAFAFIAALIWPILIFCMPAITAMIVSKLIRGKKAE